MEFNFDHVIDVINANFDFTETSFAVFPGAPVNDKNQNQKACRVLAFAKDQGIDGEKETVLELFAEHYDAVLADPDGDGHQNIRLIMRHGAASVDFANPPLARKKEYNAAEAAELIDAARDRAHRKTLAK